MELILTLSNQANLKKIAALNIKNLIVHPKKYSDRANHYFSLDEIKELCQSPFNIYINLNTMLSEFELADFDCFLAQVAKLPVKGIYFNDLGIIELAKKYGIVSKLIYNPDTLMTNSLDIKYFLEYGLDGVVISKELTKQEIQKIIAVNDKQTDLIIMGRLNMSYSRRHFIKNYYAYLKQDVNYDNCYDLNLIEATRDKRMPILENEHGCSLFTDYTLCALDELKDLKGLKRAIIDDIFLPFEQVEQALIWYQNKEAVLEKMQAKYPDYNYSSGYMYQKTNLVK